jgi:hypothetical protein
VDDDRLEGFRRREHETPTEHDPPLTGSTAPSSARVAERDRVRPNAESLGVISDRAVDRQLRLMAEPTLQDAVDPVAIPRDQRHVKLEARRGHDPAHRRPTARRRRDSQPVELAAVADRRAVGQPASSHQLGTFARDPIQMAPDPALAIPEERVDPCLGVGPAATCRRRDGDDETEVRVDRDPEMTRSSRVAKNVLERGAQRDRPSRSVATALAIRRCRVSSLFAPTTGSTQKRCML